MKREKYYRIIVDILTEVMGLPKEIIAPEKSLIDDLELSSMEIFWMIGEIESKTNVHIPDSDLNGIVTIDDLIDCIERS